MNAQDIKEVTRRINAGNLAEQITRIRETAPGHYEVTLEVELPAHEEVGR
jgi:hypothetical protein